MRLCLKYTHKRCLLTLCYVKNRANLQYHSVYIIWCHFDLYGVLGAICAI